VTPGQRACQNSRLAEQNATTSSSAVSGGSPRYREGAEILAAAADDVGGGQFVARIGHQRLHIT